MLRDQAETMKLNHRSLRSRSGCLGLLLVLCSLLFCMWLDFLSFHSLRLFFPQTLLKNEDIHAPIVDSLERISGPSSVQMQLCCLHPNTGVHEPLLRAYNTPFRNTDECCRLSCPFMHPTGRLKDICHETHILLKVTFFKCYLH